MTTVGESDFSASFDRDGLELFKFLSWVCRIREYIHHFDSVCETDNNVET